MLIRSLALLALIACTGTATDEDTQVSDTGDTGVDSDTGPDLSVLSDEVDWVVFPAGTYAMGSDEPEGDLHEWPSHSVSVGQFALTRTEIQLSVYLDCEAHGACPVLPREGNCYAGDSTRLDYPANCVDYDAAAAVCGWLGGRLATEAEWEYAARSMGQDHEYPWGSEEPSCDLVVFDNDDGVGCGTDGAQPPCSRPDGNTEQGMCDMAGNVFEWVEDWFESGYGSQPTDGSAHTGGARTYRTMRGGGIRSAVPPRTRQRTFHEPEFNYSGMGVRCAGL